MLRWQGMIVPLIWKFLQVFVEKSMLLSGWSMLFISGYLELFFSSKNSAARNTKHCSYLCPCKTYLLKAFGLIFTYCQPRSPRSSGSWRAWNNSFISAPGWRCCSMQLLKIFSNSISKATIISGTRFLTSSIWLKAVYTTQRRVTDSETLIFNIRNVKSSEIKRNLHRSSNKKAPWINMNHLKNFNLFVF